MIRRWILSFDKTMMRDAKLGKNYAAVPHLHETRVGFARCSGECAFYGRKFRLPTGNYIPSCPGRCRNLPDRIHGAEIVWRECSPVPH